MKTLIAISSLAVLVSGCADNGNDGRWKGYATTARDKLPTFFLSSFQTRRDCLHYMEMELAPGAPNADLYEEPYGCGYTGQSFVVTWLLNRVNVGGDLRCVARFPNEGGMPYYGPLLDRPDTRDKGEFWYCTHLLDF